MENNIDITKLNIIELKALAYDTLSVLENARNNLQLINQEISKRIQQTNQTPQFAIPPQYPVTPVT